MRCLLEERRYVTALTHSNPDPTKVDGFQAAGSFSQTVQYNAPDEMVELLVRRATSCWQSLRYDCLESGLLGQEGEGWAWWVSWRGERQDHWAGARPGTGQCQCGERGDCLESGARETVPAST